MGNQKTEVSCWEWGGWSFFGQFSSCTLVLRMLDLLLILAVVELTFVYVSIKNHLGIHWMLGVHITGMVLCC